MQFKFRNDFGENFCIILIGNKSGRKSEMCRGVSSHACIQEIFSLTIKEIIVGNWLHNSWNLLFPESKTFQIHILFRRNKKKIQVEQLILHKNKRDTNVELQFIKAERKFKIQITIFSY